MATQVVVAAAVLQDGRVLAARRSWPAAVAGCWEFPGGKVEDGETHQEALIRECREELGIEIAVRRPVGSSRIAPGRRLRLYRAEHLLGYPEPNVDHDLVRWFLAEELSTVPWLPADEPLLAKVSELLTPPA